MLNVYRFNGNTVVTYRSRDSTRVRVERCILFLFLDILVVSYSTATVCPYITYIYIVGRIDTRNVADITVYTRAVPFYNRKSRGFN